MIRLKFLSGFFWLRTLMKIIEQITTKTLDTFLTGINISELIYNVIVK